MRFTRSTIAFGAFARYISALLVARDSPCETLCGNVLDSTTPDDIVCRESDYPLAAAGIVFQQCITCEAGSAHVYGEKVNQESDLGAMLLIHILDGACSERLEPGLTLAIDGNIFSESEVSVSAAMPTATFVSDARVGILSYGQIAGIAIGAFVSLLVIVGCGVVTNGKRKRKAYLRKREQQRKNWPSPLVSNDMFETPISQRPLRGWGDSPVSAATTDGTFPRYVSPYSSQYNSPVSAVGGPGGGAAAAMMAWPLEKGQNIGIALSPDTAYQDADQRWPDAKGKEKDLQREAYVRRDAYMDSSEGYELQEGVNSGAGSLQPSYVHPEQYQNAPVLSHPGYGRNGSPPLNGNRPEQGDGIRPST
ncbi:hypothetical protein DL769_004891 [Monosporascus sp. CRB-8-3]|nr:hypothetical protein DL769_004891 [Monosporascus sp. CRB-8-3]